MDKDLERLIKGTKKTLENIDTMIYNVVVDYLSEELEITDNSIRFNQKNLGVIDRISKKADDFKGTLKKIFDYVLDGIKKLLGLTVTDLKKYDVRAVKTGSAVTERLLKHAATVLERNLSLELIFADVKQTAISLMSRPESIDLKTMRKVLKNKVVENKLATRYFSRWTADIYSQYQRVGANEIRKDIGLRFAIYQGGLIETSRSFCEQRNNNVYHEDEIKSWENLNFAGKPETGYNPIVDLGGYNCRHRLDWISDELAFRLRPELKEKYER